MKFPKKKYNIIYADPPWTFKTYSDKGKGKSAENHYPCMNIDDIYKLPVQDIADEDCILLMWVTYPLLKEGIKTMEEWGFTYKTCAFSWIKRIKMQIFFLMVDYFGEWDIGQELIMRYVYWEQKENQKDNQKEFIRL